MKSLKKTINIFSASFILLSFVFAISLAACSNPADGNNPSEEQTENTTDGNNPSEEQTEKTTDETNYFLVEDSYSKSGDNPVYYKLPFSAFDDATVFNKTLAQVSLINSMKTESESKIKSFYSGIGFDNIVSKNATEGKTYDDNTVADSISYTLAHKNLNGFDIIAVSVRGFGYETEWLSNFTVGESGDHQGFYSAAVKVYDGLKSYINENYSQSYSDKKIKLWVTGYSRAGAAANILSYLMITDSEKKLDVEPKNMFVYTFASPRALLEEHALAYNNVFNIVSNTDLVTHVVPSSWGFKRCGIDKVIFEGKESDYKEVFNKQTKKYSYSTKLDDLLKAYNSESKLSVFCEHDQGQEESLKYKTEPEMLEYYWKLISNKDETATGGISLKTRELYAKTVQDMAAYVYTLYTENSGKFTNIANVRITDKSFNFEKIMDILSTKEKFCAGIKELFDKAEIKYGNEETLKLNIGKLYDSIMGKNGCLSELFMLEILPSVSGMFTGAAAPDLELMRCISAHNPECYYVLLNDYTE